MGALGVFGVVDFPWLDLVVAQTVEDETHTATGCVEGRDAEDDEGDGEEAPFARGAAHGHDACVDDAEEDAEVAHGVGELLADTIHVRGGELEEFGVTVAAEDVICGAESDGEGGGVVAP